MERLTRKTPKYEIGEFKYSESYDYARDNKGFTFITNEQVMNKLGQLEDIEDKLGINLIVLFKALNECYTEDGYKGTAMILNNKEIGIKYQLSENSWSSRIYKISDYGKTWALTKEELTHEIR